MIIMGNQLSGISGEDGMSCFFIGDAGNAVNYIE